MGQVLHGYARTTAAVRRAIQHSQDLFHVARMAASVYIEQDNSAIPSTSQGL